MPPANSLPSPDSMAHLPTNTITHMARFFERLEKFRPDVPMERTHLLVGVSMIVFVGPPDENNDNEIFIGASDTNYLTYSKNKGANFEANIRDFIQWATEKEILGVVCNGEFISKATIDALDAATRKNNKE